MERDVYYIDVNRKKRDTAGAKAPRDISELCKRLGMKRFSMPVFPSKSNRIYQKLWLLFVCTFYWIKLARILEPESVVIYQHPMYGARISERFIPQIQKRKRCKFIALVHDLESLRKGIDGVIKNNKRTNEISDNVLLKHFDIIICHNSHMKHYLINQGFKPERLVELGIFDYLCDCDQVRTEKGSSPSIAIAGNLAIGKCSYIYKIYGNDENQNSSLKCHLYGINYETDCNHKNLIYHGSFSPEELPQQLEGDFGLVWDGNSVRTCEGNTGEYLKYNNPHKTSLYLAAGMPVITWSHAAIADFILEHHVGITVESLNELETVIKNISENDYKYMCENAMELGKKIRNGWFFKEAIKECFLSLPI